MSCDTVAESLTSNICVYEDVVQLIVNTMTHMYADTQEHNNRCMGAALVLSTRVH